MLRQVAVLLERENETLHAKVQALTHELARLRGDDASAAERQLVFLKELLAQRERALFGPSSEQRPRPAASTPPTAAAPRRGHGPKAQPELPRVEMMHVLDDADQTCPQCGGTLRPMAGQTEDAEEITVVERQFVLVTHKRQKYRCACNGCVDTAPGPLRLAARPDARGARYAPEFAIEVAVGKYLDHLPLERQGRVMPREGYTGIVLADGYGAYDALARAGPRFTLAHCRAHVRRKFVEAEPHYPAPCRAVLELIGQLYAVEREVPSLPAAAAVETADDLLALRGRLRQERSRAIVGEIQTWALAQRALPESSLGKAITYLLGLWAGLTRFLDNPRIPLDNNRTERGLRGVVLGRKNHYGSRSRRGTEVAALFYSLIESANVCGVEPKAYLRHAMRAALADRAAVTLPHTLLT